MVALTFGTTSGPGHVRSDALYVLTWIEHNAQQRGLGRINIPGRFQDYPAANEVQLDVE